MGLVLRSIQAADNNDDLVSLPKLNLTSTVVDSIGSGNGIAYLNTARFNKAGGSFDGKAYYRILHNGKQEIKIRKGDFVLYNKHIAIVYSDGWGDSKYNGTLGTAYDIIQAYGVGGDQRYYEGIKGKKSIFARKVLVTGAIHGVIGFGRVKLWK